ncbi:MAG: hypothetical protein M0P51_18385, partial [Methanoculleus sp.]|nr:hypothetical protein [Methanoculleus sp.]
MAAGNGDRTAIISPANNAALPPRVCPGRCISRVASFTTGKMLSSSIWFMTCVHRQHPGYRRIGST